MRSVVLVPHPVYDCYGNADLSPRQARSRLNLDPDEGVILFFGLVRQYKGLDILLEAMPEIVRRLGSKIHLMVAGEFYDSAEKYRKIIADLNLSDDVTIVDQYIPNEKVATYFRAADLLVLPYRSATQSGVIQVAEYFHLPVISTRVGGLPEMVKEGINGFLVPPEDPRRLADAVVDFFQSGRGEKMRREMAKQDNGWDRLSDAVEQLARKGRNDRQEKTIG
jgi:glycosyltransferase involved in cell wall biosynthesis